MKKFLGLILVLVCLITPAFAEPVSQEIIEQAKAQAGLFMDLKNALGLDWLDQYNAYLASPDSAPQPTWATSVVALINDNYLSSAFPTDFQIVPTGQEVTIRRTITDQGVKNVLPVYLPSVMISGNTVSLLVQRPAQWVAWEAGLNSKISKDGSDNPDVLPNASLEFGSGSKIEFVSNDGKLIGVDNLTYKGQELEDRFVNVAGDNMTGSLTISGNKVWHAGNDGSGSGLDADLLDGKDSSYYRDADKLDGQHGSFYQNASNLNAGTVPVARLSGKYNISISGDADTVDGKHASDFALSGHSHNYDDKYVNLTGDTMTGILTTPEYRINNIDTRIYEGADNAIRIRTPTGYMDIGSMTQYGANFKTDRPAFYFDKPVEASERLKIYGTGTYLTSTEGKIAGNTIWNAGNDGHGSGLDADLLDGKHASAFALAHDHPYVKKAGDTMTGNLTLQGTSINIQRPETSGGYARGIMFYSKDGSTVEAGIGMLGSGNNPPQTLYMGFGTSPWSSSAGLTVTPTNITFKNNKVWHAGNDGSGSGLDADLLDGKDSSFFTNAGNLSSGIVPVARLSGTYDIDISGNAATATKLATARTISLTGDASGSASFDGSSNISINTNVSYSSNSDKLDGYHADSFIKKSGDTATGPIYFQGGLSAEAQTKDDITTRTPSGFWQTNSATTGEGWPQTTNTWYHLLSSTHSNTGNYYAMQFAGNFFNSNDIYYRSTAGSGTTPWNKIWHSGNDGTGSGLDADLFDSKDSSFFTNASNLSSGIVPVARLSGTYNISISGNAETLDGYNHDAFVKRAGDTMTGVLTAPEYRINDANTKLIEGANNSVRVQTSYGYTEIGPQNTSHAHFMTDRASFYFNKPVLAESKLQVYATNTYLTGTEGKIAGNTVWHAGNDGSGSGLDADLLDGKHWSDIKSYIDANAGSIVAQSLGTNGYVKFNTGLMIEWGHYPYGSGYAASITINLPYPFPNACLWCNATLDSYHPGATLSSTGCSVVDRSRIKLNKGQVHGGWYWVAIGY